MLQAYICTEVSFVEKRDPSQGFLISHLISRSWGHSGGISDEWMRARLNAAKAGYCCNTRHRIIGVPSSNVSRNVASSILSRKCQMSSIHEIEGCGLVAYRALLRAGRMPMLQVLPSIV